MAQNSGYYQPVSDNDSSVKAQLPPQPPADVLAVPSAPSLGVEASPQAQSMNLPGKNLPSQSPSLSANVSPVNPQPVSMGQPPVAQQGSQMANPAKKATQSAGKGNQNASKSGKKLPLKLIAVIGVGLLLAAAAYFGYGWWQDQQMAGQVKVAPKQNEAIAENKVDEFVETYQKFRKLALESGSGYSPILLENNSGEYIVFSDYENSELIIFIRMVGFEETEDVYAWFEVKPGLWAKDQTPVHVTQENGKNVYYSITVTPIGVTPAAFAYAINDQEVIKFAEIKKEIFRYQL